MNHWALAGGFMRSDETLEQAAARELAEETGVTGCRLRPVGTYSDPARDPRGRVVSCAFAAEVDPAVTEVMSGDDALDAGWFTVSLTQAGDVYTLRLTNGGRVLTAKLRRDGERTEILENDGLAFDHAKIILDALLII